MSVLNAFYADVRARLERASAGAPSPRAQADRVLQVLDERGALEAKYLAFVAREVDGEIFGECKPSERDVAWRAT